MLRGLLATPYRLSKPLIDPQRVIKGIPLYVGYFKDLLEYRRRGGSSSVTLKDLNPHIYQKASSHGFDAHYLYQAAWAFRLILASKTEHHVDVASEAKFVAMLSAVVETTFIDIRPLAVDLDNFRSREGSILDMPYPDGSVDSLSCLHAIEHIGLGRYGDPIDPAGTLKAAKELARVVAPGGNLYLSLPIGKPRVCFNAHRVHSIAEVLEMFDGLELVEFSSVSDQREFVRGSDLDGFASAKYACGLFWFRAPASSDAG